MKDDLDDVIREEQSRGRRPVDMDARREREALREGFRQLLRLGDEALLREAMRALGLDDESPEFVRALEAWRRQRGRPPS
jgi:hypothetical protein